MIPYHAHVVLHTLRQFQSVFHQLKDAQMDSKEIKMEIVYKTVSLIHSNQAAHQDILQMVMETVSHLNQS